MPRSRAGSTSAEVKENEEFEKFARWQFCNKILIKFKYTASCEGV